MLKANLNGCAWSSEVAIRIGNVCSHGCNPEQLLPIRLIRQRRRVPEPWLR